MRGDIGIRNIVVFTHNRIIRIHTTGQGTTASRASSASATSH
jgi:hypothetical protein